MAKKQKEYMKKKKKNPTKDKGRKERLDRKPEREIESER